MFSGFAFVFVWDWQRVGQRSARSGKSKDTCSSLKRSGFEGFSKMLDAYGSV